MNYQSRINCPALLLVAKRRRITAPSQMPARLARVTHRPTRHLGTWREGKRRGYTGSGSCFWKRSEKIKKGLVHDMNLSEAQRLVRLVRAHGDALKHARSLERRVLLVLADNPDDSILHETTLAALAEALLA